MDICLEPEVVLFHLRHVLGQNLSISDEQLSDFIYDLKKLIKRDQRKRKNENKENTTQISSLQELPVALCRCHAQCQSNDETSSLVSQETGYSERSTSSSDTVVKKSDNLIKPALSFIKPWRSKPPTKGTIAFGKSDPVNLYRHYQEQWKQVHVPGETGLSRLRWTVRERMLGQDPQPRGTDAEPSFSSAYRCDCCTEFKSLDELVVEPDLSAEKNENENTANGDKFCSCACCLESSIPDEQSQPDEGKDEKLKGKNPAWAVKVKETRCSPKDVCNISFNINCQEAKELVSNPGEIKKEKLQKHKHFWKVKINFHSTCQHKNEE